MLLWFLMCAVVSFFPFVLIINGSIFKKNSPRKNSSFFAYHTALSTKSKETWEFAHSYMGNLRFKSGLILLPSSIAAMLFSFGKPENIIYRFAAVITLIQVLIFISLLIPVEISLRKNFDKNGNRK